MRFRVGVIGNGEIVRYVHLPVAREMADVELVAISSQCEERLRQSAADFGIPSLYTDWRRMLNEQPLDIVIVATPNSLHRQMASAALDLGCHVILEKPAVIEIEEGRDLLALADSRSKSVVVNMSLRFIPAVDQLRRLCGDLLDPQTTTFNVTYHIATPPQEWYFDATLAGGGVTYCTGVHVADLVAYLLGGKIKDIEVTVEGSVAPQGVEDAASLHIEFEDGRAGGSHLSWTHLGLHARVQISDATHQLALSMGDGNRWSIELDGKQVYAGTLWQDFLKHNVLRQMTMALRADEEPQPSLRQHLKVLNPLIKGYRSTLKLSSGSSRAADIRPREIWKWRV